MRVVVMVRATAESEAGVLPSAQRLADMGRFNERLARAGVLLAAERLQSSAKGARVRFSGSRRQVIDGPFAEATGLIAGVWLWQVRSLDEAIEWARRCPNPFDGESEIELRQVSDAQDVGAACGAGPEVRRPRLPSEP